MGMQNVYRSANYTKPGQYVKCFHNPEKALILHNHFPLGCLGGVCTSYPVNTSLAHLQHYRQDCVNTLKKSCKEQFKRGKGGKRKKGGDMQDTEEGMGVSDRLGGKGKKDKGRKDKQFGKKKRKF